MKDRSNEGVTSGPPEGSRDARFLSLLDEAPVLIWLSDLDGASTFLGRSWEALTGQSPDAALGWGWLEAVHPGDREDLMRTFQEARAQGASYQAEYRLRHRNGGYRWMIDTAFPRFENGALAGYIGSIVDNDDRKRSEQALEFSNRRTRIAAEAAGLGIWEWDLETNEFSFTRRAKEIFGFPLDEAPISFDQMQAVMHPGDLPEVLRLSSRALDPTVRAHEPYRYRILRSSDAAERWILAHGEALFEGGVAKRYIGTFQDITKEVASHQSLAESEARMRIAMEAGDMAVWELDLTTNLVTVSPELNRLYGFPADARPSLEDLRSRYAPGERERLERLGAEAAARGETKLKTELKHIWPDGTVKWLLVQAQTMPTTGGGAPRIIGVVVDITERKLSEERLGVVARELQHRVKNSLAVVQTLARQSFRQERAVEEGLKAFSGRLGALSQATDVMTKHDWLDADVADLVERVTRPYRDAGGDPFAIKGTSVFVPSKAAISLGMALHELCTNSAKYGALSSPSGRVSLTWGEKGDFVELVWQETGGPLVQSPTRSGFGSQLLRSEAFADSGGAVALKYLPAGLLCEIVIRKRRPLATEG